MPIPDRAPRGVDDVAEPPLAFRPILDRLAARKQLSIGMSSAAQGQYDPIQALLDITQGTRVSLSSYTPKRPPELRLYEDGEGGGADPGLARRDRRAPTPRPPSSFPGCSPARSRAAPPTSASAGAPSARRSVAADRGRPDRRVSLGSARLGRGARARSARAAAASSSPVSPTAIPGDVALDALIEQRAPGRAADRHADAARPARPAAAADRDRSGSAGRPSCARTRRTSTGSSPGSTCCRRCSTGWACACPTRVKGQPIEITAGRDAGALRVARRPPARGAAAAPARALDAARRLARRCCSAATLVADRRGMRWALRVGALAVLWVPAVVLITAALEPSRTAELLLVAVMALVLAVADRPLRRLAARAGGAGARRGRRLHRRPGLRLAADHPLAARPEPALRLALLRDRQRARGDALGAAADRRSARCSTGAGARAAASGPSPAAASSSPSRSARGGSAPTSAASSRSAAGAAVAALLMLPGGLTKRARGARGHRAGRSRSPRSRRSTC